LSSQTSLRLGLVLTALDGPYWSFCVTAVGFVRFVVVVLHATAFADHTDLIQR